MLLKFRTPSPLRPTPAVTAEKKRFDELGRWLREDVIGLLPPEAESPAPDSEE